MAISCAPSDLNRNAVKIEESLTLKQIMAALLWVQCTAQGLNCTPQNLAKQSTCLYCGLTEKQILAALLWVQCTTGGGGGGGGAGTQVVFYTAANPNVDAATTGNPLGALLAVKPGNQIYTWNSVGLTWQ